MLCNRCQKRWDDGLELWCQSKVCVYYLTRMFRTYPYFHRTIKLMLTEILSRSAAIYEEKNCHGGLRKLFTACRSNEGLWLDVRMGCEGRGTFHLLLSQEMYHWANTPPTVTYCINVACGEVIWLQSGILAREGAIHPWFGFTTGWTNVRGPGQHAHWLCEFSCILSENTDSPACCGVDLDRRQLLN